MLYIGCSAQLSSAQLARTYVRTANERTKERTTQTDRPKRRTLSSRALPKTKRACAPARSQPDAHAHFFVTHARTHVRTYAPTVRPTDRPTDDVSMYPRTHVFIHYMPPCMQSFSNSHYPLQLSLSPASQPASQSVSQPAISEEKYNTRFSFPSIHVHITYLQTAIDSTYRRPTYLSIYLSIHSTGMGAHPCRPYIPCPHTHTHTHTHTQTNQQTKLAS
jgi:hypothetical protein